jgi:hypothetical protein
MAKEICSFCGSVLSYWEIEDCNMAQTSFLMCAECLLEWEDHICEDDDYDEYDEMEG